MCRIQDKKKSDQMEVRGKKALMRKLKEEEHLKILGGLKEGIGIKMNLHAPMDSPR